MKISWFTSYWNALTQLGKPCAFALPVIRKSYKFAQVVIKKEKKKSWTCVWKMAKPTNRSRNPMSGYQSLLDANLSRTTSRNNDPQSIEDPKTSDRHVAQTTGPSTSTKSSHIVAHLHFYCSSGKVTSSRPFGLHLLNKWALTRSKQGRSVSTTYFVDTSCS